MEKIKIRIGIIGHMPIKINQRQIIRWKSELFEVVKVDEYKSFSKRSNTRGWGYTDSLLNRELPKRKSEDIFIGITNIRIKNNYISRRLEDNRVIVSLSGIHKDIRNNNIPIENLILRVIYSYALDFCMEQNMQVQKGRLELLHDETRGCIFDMAGDKSDVIYSLNKPQLCTDCIKHLEDSKVPKNTIATVNKELKKIKKRQYYVIKSWFKHRPIISTITTIAKSAMIRMFASYLYDLFKLI